MRSPRSSSKKMRSALLAHGTDVSSKTVKRRLTKDFGLKAFKPAKKKRLTPAMKLKRLNFVKKHINWSREQWSRVIFSDESCIQQFGSRKHSVWRPVGKRFNEKYSQQTMKHSPKIMIWGAISVKGTAGLFFLTPGTTMNGGKYLELLKNKLQLHMNMHECTIFMQYGAPCHKAKIFSNFLKSKKIQVLDWPGNQGCGSGSGSGGSGKFLWKRKRKLEAVNGYRFRFHLRCSTILALNVFLTQNKQLKHTITRVCEASCCRKYPLLNSQKFESTAVC